MKQGGYQILDLKNHNFATSGSSNTYNGCYELLKGTRKAVLVSGMKINGVEYRDFFALFVVSNNNIVYKVTEQVTGLIITITVKSNDTVTINFAH